MPKTPISEEPFRPDPNREHPPIEAGVSVPDQVSHAAALANALASGKAYSPTETRGKTAAKVGFPYSDSQIDHALGRLDQGELQTTDPEFEIVKSLAVEGARLIKAHRRGARQPRKISDDVTRRLDALLEAVRELSPFRLKNLTGTETLRSLRASVIEKLGVKDRDKILSEDTIRSDIQLLRPLLRLVQKGLISAPGKPIVKAAMSDKTKEEMAAGRRAVARASDGGDRVPQKQPN